MKKLIFLFLLIPSLVWAQEDTYGEADFSRRDAFTRDDLVACWNFLTPGVEGNMLGDDGKFETWTGAESGCTNCPEGWTCACSGSSDIDQETSNIFEGNTAVKFATVTNAISIRVRVNLEKNTAYQLTWKMKGSNALDDMYVRVETQGATNIYYNTTTDTWQAGSTSTTFSDMGTSWTDGSIYILTDSEDRSSTDLYIVRGGSNQTWYLDNVKLQKLKSAAPVSDTGIALEMPVTSDPVFDQCDDCQSFSGQPGDYGTTFDGTDDYLSRADDDTFDPVTFDSGGSFTAGCRFSKNSISVIGSLIGKWTTASNQRSWLLIGYNDDAVSYVSDDGTGNAGHLTTVQVANKIVANVLHSFIISYNYDGTDGSADVNLYLDENNSTSTIADGPPHNSTGEFDIGSYGSGAIFHNGYQQECCVWADALDDIDLSKWRSPYYPGNSNTRGFYVDPVNAICDQNASHATCSWDNCRDGTPDACQAEGTGVMAVFGQYSQLFDNNEIGDWSGTQDNPTLTGFNITETAGDGTANVTIYPGDSKYGDYSLRVKLTGTTSQVLISSPCLTAGIGNDVTLSTFIKKLVSTGTQFRVQAVEYDTAACGTFLQNNFAINTTTITNMQWKDKWGTIPAASWDVSTSSWQYRIVILPSGNGDDVLIDLMGAFESSYRVPPVACPEGSGSCTYNRRDYSVHNVLSDYIESEDSDAYLTGWCIGIWLYSDWGGSDGGIHRIVNIPGTAGNNNRVILTIPGAAISIYDSAAATLNATLSVDDTTWADGDWHYVEACTSNAGTVVGRHYNAENDTWYDWNSGGAGTGIQDGQDDELEVGQGVGANHLDGYFGPFKIGKYSATWPMYAWDKQPLQKPY